MKSVYSSLQNGRNRLLISLMGPLMYNWAIKGPINNESTKSEGKLSISQSCSYHSYHVSIRSRGRVPMPRRGSFTCQSTLDPRQWSFSATWQSGHQRPPGDTEYPTRARRYLHLRGCRLSVVHTGSSSDRRSFRREVYVHFHCLLLHFRPLGYSFAMKEAASIIVE